MVYSSILASICIYMDIYGCLLEPTNFYLRGKFVHHYTNGGLVVIMTPCLFEVVDYNCAHIMGYCINNRYHGNFAFLTTERDIIRKQCNC